MVFKVFTEYPTIFRKNKKSALFLVIEMAYVVAFQPFSSSKLQYSELWSCEALREKEELHVKLKSVTNTQWIPWTVLNQSKCFILINRINSSLVNLQKQSDWAQNFFQRPASVSDWATRGRSLTSKFMKAIMPVVEKDAKVFIEELKESSVVMHFSINN